MSNWVRPILITASISVLPVYSMSSNAATVIETLVVTGKADAQPSSSIISQDLMPGARTDAGEYLLGLPGVQADSRSNYAQDTRVTLRGFGARSAFGVRGVDLHIDSIPLTMPDGQGQFSGVILDSVTQIRVTTGPVAALYGNATGGVISMQTQAPTTNSIALNGVMDEAGLARQQVVAQWQQDNLGLRAQANRLQASGDRPHASAERNQFGAQAYYQFDGGVQAQIRVDREDAPLLQDPLGLTQEQWRRDPQQLNLAADSFNTRKSIQHQQTSLSLRQAEGDQRWQAAAWGGERSIEQYLGQRGDAIANSGGVVKLDRDFSGANGNYTWDMALAQRPVSVTFGAEWSMMDDRRAGYVNNDGVRGDQRRDELGQVRGQDGYAIIEWQPSTRWQWLLGARHSQLTFEVDDYFVVPGNADDSGSRTFSYLSRALETRYQLTSHWAIQASTGRGFETPTLTETAYTPGDTGFNRALGAALNRQHELGVEFQRQQLTVTLTGFSIATSNEIVVAQSDNGRTSYRNAAATTRAGAEVSGQWRWSPQWSSRYSSHYINAEYSEGEWQGKQLPGVAKLNHYFQFTWQPFGDDSLQAALAIMHRAAVATSDNNLIEAPANTHVDLALSGSIDLASDRAALQSEWWLKLANITDQDYVGSVIVNQSNGRAFEPAPGRTLSGGLTFRW